MVVVTKSEEKPQPSPIDAAKSLSTGTLIGILVDRMLQASVSPAQPHFNGQIASAAQEVIQKLITPTPLPKPTLPEPPRKKAIIIAGLLSDQFRHFTEKAPSDFEYIYVSPDDERLAGHADYVLIHRHTSHKVWDQAKAQYGLGRVSFVDGGISRMVQATWDLKSRLASALV